ncbi:MAG TPA: hypothetical protein VGQ91_15065 [Ideonella sp.]|nr:hypothetical protein [Ideonella sp.]
MLHPLVRLLATKPHLLAAHLGGYADMVSLQVADACALLRLRAWLAAGIGAGSLLGAALGGVALMFVAVLPLEQMPAPWLLALAPLLPLAAAAICWMLWRRRRSSPAGKMAALRDQLAADLALLRDAAGPD